MNTSIYDMVFMRAEDIKGDPKKYVEWFKKSITLDQNKDIKIILLSHNEDVDFVKRLMLDGLFADFLVKPLDPPLLRQRLSLIFSTSLNKELYSIEVNQPVNVAYCYKMEEISEFGLVIKSENSYKVGEIVSLYSPIFKTEKKTEIIAKCYKTEKVNKEFKSHFVFISVGDDVRKQLRTWMRLEYVKKKQSA